ncbi:lipopolysaccharide N-acetylglucosaminyltransferase [Leptolyngbya sp. NIES-3755]|nr:lipopolysaccharide N-acetylglucosaminyltransferase [Leptolyngbya sp. NIES-3755]
MKIAIAMGPWFPVPAIEGGAVPRFWQGLAEQFAASGHQVTMLCRSHPEQPDYEIINRVHYVRRGGFPQSPNIWLDLVKDLVYAITTTPMLPRTDVLVINDFWLPAFAQFHPLVDKVVVNVARFPKGQFRLYQYVDQFAVVSHPIQAAVAEQYPAATDRMRVIPNAIDTSVFYPSISSIGRSEKVLLYVGRLHPEKGIHLLIDAFAQFSKRFPDVKLKIIGPAQGNQGGGGESYLATLKQKAIGLRIEFVGPIFDPHQLAETYRAADLFCYPSLAEKGESFGVAPLEAMACGLVPIVSNLACFQDFIEHKNTGYIFDHQSSQPADQLALTLETAFSNWSSTCKIARDAAQKATQYSYEKIAQQYLAQFEQLLRT